MISRPEPFDVVVIGAGPAGLSATAAAVKYGARTAVIDAGPVPGGQFWRHPADSFGPSRSPLTERLAYLHHDLGTYRRLLASLRIVAGAGGYQPQHHVWTIVKEADSFAVHAVDRSGLTERAVEIRGRRIVLAPGAFDRQLPFPGWDLPGVMTAGGVQALLKGHGVAAGSRIIVAGTGPFLLPVAAGLVQSGAVVVEICEAAAPVSWTRHPSAMLRNAAKMGEAMNYARILARHRVPLRSRSAVVAALGRDRLEQVLVSSLDADGRVVPGSQRLLSVDVVAVGWGFTPSIELALTLGCATRPDVDGSTVCQVDEHQSSSVPGAFIAGEACGVGGAALAVAEGAVAGAAAAGIDISVGGPLGKVARMRAFAAAMHRVHPVPTGWTGWLDDETLICRCEEVTLSQLREAATEFMADDARTVKLLCRVGMGWCQGRVCADPVRRIMAERSGHQSPETIDSRPVASPIRLGTIADSA